MFRNEMGRYRESSNRFTELHGITYQNVHPHESLKSQFTEHSLTAYHVMLS
jgi:hypothetical protein